MGESTDADLFEADLATAIAAYRAQRASERDRPDLRKVRSQLMRARKAAGQPQPLGGIHPAAVLLREMNADQSPTGRLVMRLLDMALAELAPPAAVTNRRPIIPVPEHFDRHSTDLLAFRRKQMAAWDELWKPGRYCSVSEVRQAIVGAKPERRALERLQEALQRVRVPRFGPTKIAQRTLALRLVIICSRHPAVAPQSVAEFAALLDRALDRTDRVGLARNTTTEKLARRALEALGGYPRLRI